MSMVTLQGIGILVIFVVCVALMMTQKLPTLLALPIMAIGIALTAGIPFFSSDPKQFTIAKDILDGGAMRLSTAIAGLMFCAWFGQLLTKVGITRTLIRKAAELAGDRPLPISLAFLAVCSIIISAANGLGMVILLGTIIIPIMITVGVEPFVAGTVLLLANTIGTVFCASTQAVYTDALKLPLATVTSYSWLQGVPIIALAILMTCYYIIKGKHKTRKAWAMPQPAQTETNVRSIALISPIIPVVLIFAFKFPLVPSILIGIVAALVLSTPKNVIQVISSSFVEGVQDVAFAVALMVVIGITLASVSAPQVAKILNPAVSLIIPHNAVMYVLIFGVLSFLSLYRGPLNMWGMGSGLITLLVSSGMNPIGAMVAFRVVSNVQSLCDPTNSHQVWVADFTKIEVNEYTKRNVLWVVASTFLGLILATFFVKI